jgi:hypothetical protein
MLCKRQSAVCRHRINVIGIKYSQAPGDHLGSKLLAVFYKKGIGDGLVFHGNIRCYLKTVVAGVLNQLG